MNKVKLTRLQTSHNTPWEDIQGVANFQPQKGYPLIVVHGGSVFTSSPVQEIKAIQMSDGVLYECSTKNSVYLITYYA
jgi:hypothetical protein